MENSCKKQQSSSSEFGRNMMQKLAVETRFW